VALIQISGEIDRFVLYFDTPRRDINAYAFATSLVGLADAIREANAAVNPGYSIEVVVEALADGSFQAVVRTVFEKTRSLFSNEAVKAIVYGIIATHIYEVAIKDEPAPQVIVDGETVVIKTNQHTIIIPRSVYEAKKQLENSTRFNGAIDQVVKGAAADSSVRGIGLKTEPNKDSPPLYIPREKFGVFDRRQGDLTGDRHVVEVANIEISRAILERGTRRWEFYWRGVRIAAPVLDERFFNRFFAHEIKIAPGDGLKVILRITQTLQKDTGIFVNTAYEVVEVIEHIPRLKQSGI
jgi:hypothetical protein